MEIYGYVYEYYTCRVASKERYTSVRKVAAEHMSQSFKSLTHLDITSCLGIDTRNRAPEITATLTSFPRSMSDSLQLRANLYVS